MKRTIIAVELPRGVPQLEVNIQDPGTIHGFFFALREKKVLTALHLPGGNNGAGQIMEEVPHLLVEVDPDAPVRKHRFAIVGTGEILEAESLTFRATIASRNGNLFHLFEGPAPPVEPEA